MIYRLRVSPWGRSSRWRSPAARKPPRPQRGPRVDAPGIPTHPRGRYPRSSLARHPLNRSRSTFRMSSTPEVSHHRHSRKAAAQERADQSGQQFPLRGNILKDLADTSTGAITEDSGQLTKFHGIYMQDDRDLRNQRRKEGKEKAFTFMARGRMPGGVCSPDQWLEDRRASAASPTATAPAQAHDAPDLPVPRRGANPTCAR